MQFTIRSLILAWLGCVMPLSQAADDPRPGGLPSGVDPGELKVTAIGGTEPSKHLQLPLTHTEVNITVAGFVANTSVIQHYTNPFDKPIEAVYTFPLPHKAAVDSMTMHVGERVIRSTIQKKDEARKIYQQAKTEGKRTALLEQERPNIFTQSVGNIMPGDQIKIEITYVDLLEYQDAGEFELVFPMVVGPRYIPGKPQGHTGTGFAPDTDKVPDASRITPPVLKPGERSGHDISLTVNLDAHLKIQGLHSTSHRIDIAEISDSASKITLRAEDSIPNKDFILRYQVAGQAPEMAVIAHHNAEQGGYFTLMVLPQQQVGADSTVPRDLIFILDTSGSMFGMPLEKSKDVVYRLLAGMRPTDRFNVVRFSGDTGTLWPESRANTSSNVAQARQFIQSLQGSGGTNMDSGLIEALTQPAAEGRMRIAFLFTDGYVGNDEEILASIERERRGARMFTVGLGSSVNRDLLDRAATVGLGEAFYIRQDEDAADTIEKIFKRVDRPNLAHIQINWKNLDVYALTPQRIPDLWQGQPILVHGRYKTGGRANIDITGVLGSVPYTHSLAVELPVNHPANASMASVWARATIQDLMLARARNPNQDNTFVEQITDLGLQYRILTNWTSFVAVEEKVVNKDGKPQTVVQPVELPEGVDYHGVFGNELADESTSVRSMMPQALATSPPLGYGGSRIYAESGGSPRLYGNLHGRSYDADSSYKLRRRAYDKEDRGLPRSPAPEPLSVAPAAKSAPSPAEAQNLICLYRGLSVSGARSYPEVRAILDAGWPQLCTAIAKVTTDPKLRHIIIRLTVEADGKINIVIPIPVLAIPKDLKDSILAALHKLVFPPITTGPTEIKLWLHIGNK